MPRVCCWVPQAHSMHTRWATLRVLCCVVVLLCRFVPRPRCVPRCHRTATQLMLGRSQGSDQPQGSSLQAVCVLTSTRQCSDVLLERTQRDCFAPCC